MTILQNLEETTELLYITIFLYFRTKFTDYFKHECTLQHCQIVSFNSFEENITTMMN